LYTTYLIAAVLMTLSVLEGHTPIASLFKCNISYFWRVTPSPCICRASCSVWTGLGLLLALMFQMAPYVGYICVCVCCVVSVADRVVDVPGPHVRLVQGSLRSKEWRSLGRRLGCSDAKLDQLKCDYHHEGLREVIYQTLRDWREDRGNDARLAVLARALLDIGRPDIAIQLQDTPRQ